VRGDAWPGAGEALPAYSVRVSKRARRVRLVMTEDGGLEVVVPHRFDRRHVPGLVESKRDWISRAAARVAARAEARRSRLESDPPRLPGLIRLPAVGEEWVVEYRPGPSRRASDPRGSATVTVRERPGRRLLVTGDPDDFEACRRALSRWLRRRATRAFVPWVADTALRHRLQYERVSVRLQRTRWASCSRRGTISLNAKLLFLQREFVDYVVLHELCHVPEMNHSPRFWARLEAHDPEYRVRRLLLRTSGTSVPTWVDHGPAGPGV
jgi:predicted metal-dependent hydrolase